MTRYIPIGGTRAWNDRGALKRRWWQKDSEFATKMAGLDCYMVDPDQPFVWTTDMNGIHFWKRWKFWGNHDNFSDHRDWVAGGENLIRYCDSVRGSIPFDERNFITHSHGFQVWAYAAAFGLRCRRLISIAPPSRHDMEKTIRMARQNVDQWMLIVDASGDGMANLGAFGDGILWGSQVFNVPGCRPDVMVRIKDIEHSRLLSDRFDLWHSELLVDFLR